MDFEIITPEDVSHLNKEQILSIMNDFFKEIQKNNENDKENTTYETQYKTLKFLISMMQIANENKKNMSII